MTKFYQLALWIKENTVTGPTASFRKNDLKEELDLDIVSTCEEDTINRILLTYNFLFEREKEKKLISLLIEGRKVIEFKEGEQNSNFINMFIYMRKIHFEKHLLSSKYSTFNNDEEELVQESLNLYSHNVMNKVLQLLSSFESCKPSWKFDKVFYTQKTLSQKIIASRKIKH